MADESPLGPLEVPSVSATGSAAGASSNRSEAARIASRWAAVVARAPEATLAERATGPLDCVDARTPPGPLGGPRRLAALPAARIEAVRSAAEVKTTLVVPAGTGAGLAGGVTAAGPDRGAGAGESFRITGPTGGGAGSEETFGGSTEVTFGGCTEVTFGGSTDECFGSSVLGRGVASFGELGTGTVNAGCEGAGTLDGAVGTGTETCGEGCKETRGTTVATVSVALDTVRPGDGTAPLVAVSTAPVTAVGSEGAA